MSLILPGGLAVLLPLFYGVARGRYAAERFGRVAAEHWSKPWYVLTVISLLVFLLVAILRIQKSRQFVGVFDRGVRLKLVKSQAFRWEQLAGVSIETYRYDFLGISTSPLMRGVIYPNTGTPIHLSNAIEDLPELLTLLKSKLYPRLYPFLQSNLQSGQWLHFGPLAIQQKGIKLFNHNKPRQAQPIPWSHVIHVDINSGFLMVELSDRPSLKLPVSKIPNIELLIQLIQLGVNS